jgi:hypothetical protein
VSAQDDVTQAAGSVVSATGETTLASTAGDITLDGAGNDFGGTVNASGGNVELADANGIELGNVDADGTLGVTAEGDVTQADGSTISATGETTLASATGDITLDGENNDFGVVNASGGNIALADANGIELGDVNASGSLGVSAEGNITQADGGTVSTGGETTLASANGDITLVSESNDFGGTVNAAGGNVALADANGIELGDVNASGSLGVSAEGDITQADGSTISATGETTLAAGGDITLDGENNDFLVVNATG